MSLATLKFIPKGQDYLAIDWEASKIYHIDPAHDIPQVTGTHMLPLEGEYYIMPEHDFSVHRVEIIRDERNEIVDVRFVVVVRDEA